MSHYLSQIAARNTGPDQPLLTPAHSPVETALNDPFDRSSIAPETHRASEVTPITTQAPIAGKEVIEPAQPANDPLAKATAPEQPVAIKPVYLSKHIERNYYYTREHTNTVVTKGRDTTKVVHAERESPVLSIIPTVQNSTAASLTATKQTGTPQNINPVQQLNRILTTELVPKQQSSLSEKSSIVEQQSPEIQPLATATQHDNKPALLQPSLPVQPAVTPQKEKPVPALVIGKITVEIVPAQKPVNKIINHVVKPQPPATSSTQRNKNSFGLDQL